MLQMYRTLSPTRGTNCVREPETVERWDEELVLSRHAQERMLERGISEQAIREVIRNHNHATTQPDGCVVYEGVHQGRRYKVIVNHSVQPGRVVTAYPTRG